MHRFVLTLSMAGLALAPLSSARAGDVDFAKLAEQYLGAHPVDGKRPGEATLTEILDTYYATAALGVFDVRFPRLFMDEKSRVDDFKATCRALLDVQVAWLDWIGAPATQGEQARADAQAIAKWLAPLKPTAGAHKAEDFYAAFAGSESIRPAVTRFAESLRSGSALGFEPHAHSPQVFLISPTRQDFIELAALMGHFQASAQGLYWNQSLITWTEFAWEEIQVVSIQYPPVKPRGDDLSEGIPMDSREPTGLLQHVAQRGAVALCWHCFGQALDPAFEMGIAQTMVVDLYGQNNVRSGGGGRGGEAAAWEAFIPGGNSNGGALPAQNADSTWRGNVGADYFEKSLRDAQKSGAKAAAKAKDEKQAFFQLTAGNTSKKQFVRAPFFGVAARGKELPAPEFLTDYMEFFRAYKTALVHWMRESASGRDSKPKFAALLRNVNEAGSAATFEEVVQETYGQPFSAPQSEPDSLEWRFLDWLAHQ